MRLAIFITAMVILSSCQKVSSGSGTTNSVNQLNPDVPDPDPANPPPANPPPANGSFAAFTIPTKTSSKPNPLTGIVFWSDNGKMAAYQNSIALEFKYFSYDEVASGSASTGYTYNWSAVTTFLNQAASRGRHGIVRFRETGIFVTYKIASRLRAGLRSFPLKLLLKFDYQLKGLQPVFLIADFQFQVL